MALNVIIESQIPMFKNNAPTTEQGHRLGQKVKCRITGIEGVVMQMVKHIAGCEFVWVDCPVDKGEGVEFESRSISSKFADIIDNEKVKEYEERFKANFKKIPNLELGCEVINKPVNKSGIVISVSYDRSGDLYIDYTQKYKPNSTKDLSIVESANSLDVVGAGVSKKIKANIKKRKSGKLDKIEVGDKAKSLIDGCEGTVILVSDMLNGTKQIAIQPLSVNNLKPKAEYYDWEVLELIKQKEIPKVEKDGTGCVRWEGLEQRPYPM